MFKLFERDKCKTLTLDLESRELDNAKTIVPGTILYDGAGGVRKATTGDDLTPATSGLFYIANDYYDNTVNVTMYNRSDAPSSGKIAGIPIMEYFDAEIDLAAGMQKGDMLSVEDGEIVVATAGLLVFAMVKEDNAETGDAVPTKVTTWVHRYVVPEA